MNIFQKSFFITVFVLIFASSAISQTENNQSETPNKIAVINSKIFEDKEKGIKELVAVYAKLDEEFEPLIRELTELYNQMQPLLKCLRALHCNEIKGRKEFDEKYNKLEFLNKQYNVFENWVKEKYEKRESELTEKINKKIAEALKQFAKKNGYRIIFDASKLNTPYLDKSFDVTNDFIKYYNENFDN